MSISLSAASQYALLECTDARVLRKDGQHLARTKMLAIDCTMVLLFIRVIGMDRLLSQSNHGIVSDTDALRSSSCEKRTKGWRCERPSCANGDTARQDAV